jgi:homoserine kinase type II
VQKLPRLRQCALIGAELARFHLAGADFAHLRPNPRGIDWMVAVRDMLADYLGDADQQAIEATLRAVQGFDLEALPRGAIHADLFHDNALFHGTELGGILDFDYACTDAFVFDIAVLVNDWCINPQYALETHRVDAVLEAYRQQRELTSIEIEALPLMLRLAALRFWLSRLYDKVFPLAGELTFIKCPDAFRDMHRLRSSAQQRPDDSGSAPR